MSTQSEADACRCETPVPWIDERVLDRVGWVQLVERIPLTICRTCMKSLPPDAGGAA